MAGLPEIQSSFIPVCQWAFNQKRRFYYAGGDTEKIFGRSAGDLLHQHVSLIDDSSKSWSARLERVLSGEVPIESSSAPAREDISVTHVAIRAHDGSVAYAAGFGYETKQAVPRAQELEHAALAILQVLKSERRRTERFLHDVVAQCLSGTGLQFELLRLEIEAQGVKVAPGMGGIHGLLEDVLNKIRSFSAGEDIEP